MYNISLYSNKNIFTLHPALQLEHKSDKFGLAIMEITRTNCYDRIGYVTGKNVNRVSENKIIYLSLFCRSNPSTIRYVCSLQWMIIFVANFILVTLSVETLNYKVISTP